MNVRHIKVIVPDPIEPPRGAAWAADAVVWAWHHVQRLASALRGTVRAQRRTASRTQRHRRVV